MVQGRVPDLEKQERVAALRARGWTLTRIAGLMMISTQRVHQILSRKERRTTSWAVRCRDCRRKIVSRGVIHGETNMVLCLSCLAGHDEATFGERLMAHRLAAGMTRSELARKSGLTYWAIRVVEAGRSDPGEFDRKRLAEALGLDHIC
jgi:transcriptional regulator with XRE-family HTH domain